MSKLARLKPETTCLMICDVQEKVYTINPLSRPCVYVLSFDASPRYCAAQFRAAIYRFATVVTGAQRMVRAANELSMPVIVTEQYPKGLGHTVEELDLSKAAAVVAKTDFSMIVPEVTAKLNECKTTDAVIVGLESHVCVQQTTLDLIAGGYNVHICVDAISSQSPTDRACGLHRAAGAGAFLTTTESVMMELIRSKDHPSFKAISNTLKETRPAEPLEFM